MIFVRRSLFLVSLFLLMNSSFAQKGVSFTHHPDKQEIAIHINGQHFSNFLYHDALKKHVLYPLKTAGGTIITRGFPINTLPGERVDHQHHLGHWLNYGDVNGLDFWNNSSARSAEQRHKYGEIRHQEIVKMKGGKKRGTLATKSHWVGPDGEILLDESTQFIFHQQEAIQIIDRTTILTAQTEVRFDDNKEGMVAIRVARGLELPSDRPGWFADANGKAFPEKTVNEKRTYGDYLSSEGTTGGKVWGTRAEWMLLSGEVDGKAVAAVIIDHPENVGYPTYWHARGYGLFSANPLGQKVFSKGKEELMFKLKEGESVTFKYRILIGEGELEKELIEELGDDFTEAEDQ